MWLTRYYGGHAACTLQRGERGASTLGPRSLDATTRDLPRTSRLSGFDSVTRAGHISEITDNTRAGTRVAGVL